MHNADKWYKHNLKTVEERNAITILYDISSHTDREISASHLGIVINNNLNQDKKKYILTDLPIPSDKNTFTQDPEKLLKDKDLD